MTDEEAHQSARLLQGYRHLLVNHAWTDDFMPRLAKLEQEHVEGCTALHLTPEKRSEHVHAVHVLAELRVYAERKVKELDEALKAHVMR